MIIFFLDFFIHPDQPRKPCTMSKDLVKPGDLTAAAAIIQSALAFPDGVPYASVSSSLDSQIKELSDRIEKYDHYNDERHDMVIGRLTYLDRRQSEMSARLQEAIVTLSAELKTTQAELSQLKESIKDLQASVENLQSTWYHRLNATIRRLFKGY